MDGNRTITSHLADLLRQRREQKGNPDRKPIDMNDPTSSTKVLIYSRAFGGYLTTDKSKYSRRFSDVGLFDREDGEAFVASGHSDWMLELEPFWWPDEIHVLHQAGLQATMMMTGFASACDRWKAAATKVVNESKTMSMTVRSRAIFDELAELVEATKES